MKRIFCLLCCVWVMVALLPMSVWAEDVRERMTASTTEATTEAVTEAVTEAATPSEELEDIMATATPEQIEQIKQYILYGVGELSKYEGTDGLTAFVLKHLNEIAWVAAGVCFIIFAIVFKAKGKALSDSAITMNNNACEMVEQSEARISEANKACEARIKEMLEEATALHETTLKELCLVKHRETACAEALKLMATEINSLLQVANLPEWKRDELQAVFNEALSCVEEVNTHDE